MTEKKKAPDLRFPGFTDPWEQRKLVEITSVAPFKPYLKEAFEEGKYEVIQQGDNPILGYADGEPFFDFEKVTLFGDHTLSLYKPKSPFFVATDGLKILYSDGMEGDFYYYLLEKYKPDSEGYKRHFSILKECGCCFPRNTSEQRKIGEFLSSLDTTITLHQRKVDDLKTMKKCLLQKMFPKEGENTPELRFPGFTDPWEQRKFGDVLETVTDYVAAGSFADLAKNVEYRDKPDYAQLVRTMDLKNGFTSSQEVFVDEKAFNYLYRVNLDKDCIILPNIGNCGEVYFVRPEALPYEHNVLGPNAIYVRSETNNNMFLSTLFQAKDFQTKLSLIVSPNGQTKFNKTELKQIELVLPNSETEQNKIGEFFFRLDNTITLHQRKVDDLKTMKKCLLQKMFI